MQELHELKVLPAIVAALGIVALGYAGCGGSGGSPPSLSPSVNREACTQPQYDSSTPFSPREKHAFIVMFENHSYEEVFNNPSMPFLNSLAQKYAFAQGYYASAHPSTPDYFMLTAGQKISDNDSFSSTVADDNIVRRLVQAGLTWKEYSESLPSPGYDGPDASPYVEHHNPLSYFSDVRNDSAQLKNLVPFTEFFTDLDAHTLPSYAFIVPDDTHDAHSCLMTEPNCTDDQKLATADHWLKDNIGPLIYSTDFNQPGGGILIVTFDESVDSDRTGLSEGHGGHILWVVVGTDVKHAYTSTTCHQHSSTLHFMSHVLGLTNSPGAAETAPDMREFMVGN